MTRDQAIIVRLLACICATTKPKDRVFLPAYRKACMDPSVNKLLIRGRNAKLAAAIISEEHAECFKANIHHTQRK